MNKVNNLGSYFVVKVLWKSSKMFFFFIISITNKILDFLEDYHKEDYHTRGLS